MAKTKKDFQSEQSRAAILAATMNLISKHGFNGTSIDKIAGESGLSKGSIFWHFENKENLFVAVIDAIRDGLLQGVMIGQESATSARERIELLLTNYTRLIEHDCSRCLDLTVLIIEMVETHPDMAEKLRDVFSDLTTVLVALLEDGIRSGEIDESVDPEGTAYAVVGNLQGMTVQFYLNRDKFQYARFMKAYRNLVLNGLFSD